MGNVKGNRYWEARLPPHFRRPNSSGPSIELGNFIREKYVDRRYAAMDAPDGQPPTIENYLSHPYGGAGPPAPAPVAGVQRAPAAVANGRGPVGRLQPPGV